MWRLSRVLCHNRNDKARMSHNFASDTLSRVYRDAVYAPQARHQSHPLFPEWGPVDPKQDVTNHVGNLGVMSAAAAALRQSEASQTAHDTATDVKDVAQSHAHVHAANHSHDHGRQPPDGAPAKPVVSPFENMSDASTAAATSVTGRATASAIERLRGSTHRSETATSTGGTKTGAASAPRRSQSASGASRHSGVQKEILVLYRRSLRETLRMRDVQTQKNLQAFIHDEYAKNMDVPRKHITKIEWHINYAKRKLEDLQAMSPSTRFSIRD